MNSEEQKKNEYSREFEILGKKFKAERDLEYSFWSLRYGNKSIPGNYTTFSKAVEGAHAFLMNEKKFPKDNKAA